MINTIRVSCRSLPSPPLLSILPTTIPRKFCFSTELAEGLHGITFLRKDVGVALELHAVEGLHGSIYLFSTGLSEGLHGINYLRGIVVGSIRVRLPCSLSASFFPLFLTAAFVPPPEVYNYVLSIICCTFVFAGLPRLIFFSIK